MNEKRIVTYSLLAHINNNNIGIRDFNDIYKPLIKRVISRMNREGNNRGKSLLEIKDLIYESYSLDMPYPILSKIIKSISLDQNKDGEVNFQYFEDGSYIISDYSFSEYESIIREQEAEIEYLNDIYNDFIITKGEKVEDNKTIFEFLEQNKIALSKYFAEQTTIEPEIDFSLQAEFINSVKSNKRVLSILKKVYLGSIISSYLTINESGLKTDLEFLIDTNFIIGLLDLGSVEENHTCTKIVEIANKLGCKLTVLDFTIRETEALLIRTAEDFENSFLPKKVDPHSIYNACDRKNISKTDLQGIINQLTQSLQNEHNVTLIPNTTRLENIAKYSKDYNFYKKIRSSNYGALHDATAVTYVKEKRGKEVSEFNSSKCWFVTNTSHNLVLNKNNGFLPEVIRADNLINILWLTNPLINVSDVVNIGLSKLVSCAISNSLPNIRVLKELDANMQKYSIKGVKPEEIVRVASAVANKTIINLEELNKLADTKPEEFIKKIHDISKSVEKNEKLKDERFNTFLEELANNSEKRISIKIKELEKNYLLKVDEISKANLHEKQIIENNLIQTRKEAYSKLKPTADYIERKSRKNATLLMSIFTVFPLIAILIIYVFIDKKKFEFYIFPISLAPAIFSYLFFIIFKKENNPQVIFENLKEKQLKKIIKRLSFDYKYFKNLEEDFDKKIISKS
jgi:hypothetical protein